MGIEVTFGIGLSVGVTLAFLLVWGLRVSERRRARRNLASAFIGESDKRRFFAMLHMGGIAGPVEAVRAAIVAERYSMDDRSNMPTTETEAAKLTIEQLNTKVAMTEWRFQNTSNQSQRESIFRLLVWLEKCREQLHGIPAPSRSPLPKN